MKATVFFLLIGITLGSAKPHAESDRKLFARIWLGGTSSTVDGTGAALAGYATHIYYDRRGEGDRIESSSFISAAAFGYDWTNYLTSEFIYTNNGASYVIITDSVSRSNGYPIEISHSVTTTTNTDNGNQSFTDQTVTVPGSPPSETITTTTDAFSTNYSYYQTETRDTNGNLLSWSLYSQTNDYLHSQQSFLNERGGNDETHPDFVDKFTYTFDPLGNIILSTSYFEFNGFVFSDVTSNSYVFDQMGRVLFSNSQFDSGADGTIDSVTVTEFSYDKSGNVTEQNSKRFAGDGTFLGKSVSSITYDHFGSVLSQDTKQFGPNGTLQGEIVASFIHDQFGNTLYAESKWLDANGAIINRTTDTEIYVPKGQAFGHAPKAQRFLDRIRNGKGHGPRT